jgi:hypothetical protein
VVELDQFARELRGEVRQLVLDLLHSKVGFGMPENLRSFCRFFLGKLMLSM